MLYLAFWQTKASLLPFLVEVDCRRGKGVSERCYSVFFASVTLGLKLDMLHYAVAQKASAQLGVNPLILRYRVSNK